MDVFDKEGVLDRVDGDVELLKELVSICKKDFEVKLPDLKQMVASRDYHKVSELAHSLKSGLGNLGAVLAHNAANILEADGKNRAAHLIDQHLVEFEMETRRFFDVFDKEVF